MKRIFHLFFVPLIAAALICLPPFHIASADTACGVSSGSLLSGGSISITAPPGHTYTFVYTGAATGTITITGTLSIVNGTGGTLFFTIFDLNGTCWVTYFNPGDGRIDPHANERIVVYCNTGLIPATLDVWGVQSDSKGMPLAQFRISELLAAGAKGITRDLGANGRIVVGMYNSTLFGISWIGGPLGGSGQGDFRKTFNCDFPRPTSSTSSQPPASSTNPQTATCVSNYTVQPGDTLFHIAVTHGTTVQVLAALNHISNPALIFVGQVLCLPT